MKIIANSSQLADYLSSFHEIILFDPICDFLFLWNWCAFIIITKWIIKMLFSALNKPNLTNFVAFQHKVTNIINMKIQCTVLNLFTINNGYLMIFCILCVDFSFIFNWAAVLYFVIKKCLTHLEALNWSICIVNFASLC